MREIVLGTAGHVDHGKTSLVRALTGMETDRLKEEKKRGITIELGFAFLDLPCGHRLGIVDVPGHEKFVKNMVAGAAGIDLVAFVIAADEGIMPQTREHFEICSLLGVSHGLIIITKIDMVEPDWLEMVKEEVRAFFKGSFLDSAPLVGVSSTTGQGIEEVKATLDRILAAADFAEARGPFRLPVDRIFSMKGFGAVVTGTSISGRISVGQEVCIYPRERMAKIRGIQVHGRDVEEVEAGHRTAVNIQGLEKEFVARGDVLASPNSLQPVYMMDADFTYLASNAKNLKNRTRVRFHLGTAEIMGRLVLIDEEEAIPGSRINVQLLFEEPVTAWPGDHYVVRGYSPVWTIGGGLILNNNPGRKRRRFKAVNREIFDVYHHGTVEDQAIFQLLDSGVQGMTFTELEIRLGIFGKQLKKILNKPISARRIIVVDSDRQWMIGDTIAEKLANDTLAMLADFHRQYPMKEGIGREELRSRLNQGLEQKLFQLIVNGLEKQQQIVQDKALVRLASHRVSLQEDAQAMRQEMMACFTKAGLTPPTRKELGQIFAGHTGSLVAEILEVLVNDNELIRVSEELFYSATVLADLQEKLLDFLKRQGAINAQEFKALTGISRKFSIPLLEYFDRQKVTIRVEDTRVLREKK